MDENFIGIMMREHRLPIYIVGGAFFVGFMLLNTFVALASEDRQMISSPDGKSFVELQCKDISPYDCDIRAVDSQQRSIPVWGEQKVPAVTWHDDYLAEIMVSCGFPCFSSKFYSPGIGVSDSMMFVLAVHATKQLAVQATYDSLEVVKIFQKSLLPLSVVKLDFSPGGMVLNAIIDVEFVNDGQLFVLYLSGDDFVEKSATISIDTE